MSDLASDLYGTSEPTGLISAQLQQESGNRDFTPNGQPVTSPAGAMYAMQVMPNTASDPGFGVTPAKDNSPEEYDRVGRDYITALHQHYGDLPTALAAYNWGPHNVDKYGVENAPPETRNYVSSIMGKIGNAIVPSAEAAEAPKVDLAQELYGQKSQPAAGKDDLAAELYGNEPISVGEDVKRTLKENVLPNLPLAPLGMLSYPLELAHRGADYLGKNAADLTRSAMGLPKAPDQPYEPLIATPNKMTADIAEAIGHPLYEPQTWQGRVTEGLGTMSPFLAGSALKTGLEEAARAAPTIASQVGKFLTGAGGNIAKTAPAAVGAVAAPEIVKAGGGGEEAQFFSSLPGAVLGAKTASATAEGLGNIGRGIMSDSPKTIADTNQALHDNSSAIFNQTRQNGAVFNPDAMQDTISDVAKAISKNGKLDPKLHPATIDDLKYLAQKSSEGPMDLEDYHIIMQRLGKNISAGGTDGQASLVAKNSLWKSIMNKDSSDLIEGNPDAIDALNHGMKTWAQFKRFDDLTDIAKQADGNSARQKALLSRYVNNEDNLKGYSEEEKDALRKAAKSSLPETLFNVVGKLGFDFGNIRGYAAPLAEIGAGAIAHSPLSGVVIPATAAKYVGKALGRGKFQSALDLASKPIEPPVYGQRQAPAKAAQAALPSPNINVPAGGFGAQQETQPDPMAPQRQPTGQAAIPNNFYAPNSRALTYQPRPNFVSTAEGKTSAVPNAQVGPYKFGEAEGMPMSKGELDSIRALESQAQEYRGNLETEAQKRNLKYVGLTNEQIINEIKAHDEWTSKYYTFTKSRSDTFSQNPTQEGQNAIQPGDNKRSQKNTGGYIQSNEQLKTGPAKKRGGPGTMDRIKKSSRPSQGA